MKDELVRRLTGGSNEEELRADFERELQEAKVHAEKLLKAREALNDWTATTIEELDESTALSILRERLTEMENQLRNRPVTVALRRASA